MTMLLAPALPWSSWAPTSNQHSQPQQQQQHQAAKGTKSITKKLTKKNMVSTTVALLCCGITVVFFGSNFVPVKTVETGDGVFFSWVLCSGIFFVGVVVNFAEGFPQFEPWAMLGGAIWCTGNLMSVPTIKLIGLSLGMLLWGTTNMLIGWATGRFGLFGVKPQLSCSTKGADQNSCIHDIGLNYLGMILACVSLIIYVFVEPEDMEKNKQGIPKVSDSDRLLDHIRNEWIT